MVLISRVILNAFSTRGKENLSETEKSAAEAPFADIEKMCRL